jgi:hypothetical protein
VPDLRVSRIDRVGPGGRERVAPGHGGCVGTPYRYKLQLVPHERSVVGVGDQQWMNAVDPLRGWELISSRVTDEGDELRLLRHIVTAQQQVS